MNNLATSSETYTWASTPCLGYCHPLHLADSISFLLSSVEYSTIQMNGQPGVDGVSEKAIPVAGDGGDGVKNELTETNLAKSISRFIRKAKLVRRYQIVFQ